MWAPLFLIKSTFLCLNPVLLLYSCGVMGMMRLNDVHSIPKTRLPIFCYWINKFYHIRSAFLLLFPSPSFFLDIATRVGCGQKSKLTPRNNFFHSVSGAIAQSKAWKRLGHFLSALQGKSCNLETLNFHQPLRVPLCFLTILPLWFVSELQLVPSHHDRVAFVPTGYKTMLLCCFIHIKLKSLWKDEARPNQLQSESWIGTDQSYPCSGGLIARDFKCQSTTLSWIMVFLWFPAIIWSKNRKLPHGL